MENLAERINNALAKEDIQAEKLANSVRLALLLLLTCIALVNARSVSFEANMMNLCALVMGYTYGLIVFFRIRRARYHPLMKYITSCLDVLLVFSLLFMYTRIEIPSVALKNYVFLVLFPLITLTAFRFDRMLTWIAGGLSVALYLGLIFYLYLFKMVAFTHGGYDSELFSSDVTYIGQATKVLILSGFILLVAYLARYSRTLFGKLVHDELTIKSQQEMMDWELKIASQVQTRFLPNAFPSLPGLDIFGTVQQGKYVGGDYCDFVRLTDHKLLIVVADVSGHGVPAALIMAEVHASIQLLSSMELDLQDLVQRLNILLHQSTDKKHFVTFFAAEIDTAGKKMTFINAGHPPPLVFSQGQLHPLAQGTIPLGLRLSLPHMTVHTEKFAPGDLVVSYTDGILERRNSQDQEYGEERLGDFVRSNWHLDVEPFAVKLLKEVKDFGQGRDLEDDVGLAVAKFIESK
jgi:hypothetical protein